MSTMLRMPFRSKTRRERVQATAEHFLGRSRDQAESIRRTLPETTELLDEALAQARSALQRIEELRAQNQPAVDRGVRFARQAAADAALGVARAAAPKQSRSKTPFVVVGLLVAGALAFGLLSRCGVLNATAVPERRGKQSTGTAPEAVVM